MNKRDSKLTTQKTDGKAVRKNKRKKNSVRETTEAILVALIAAMFLRAFVVQAFRIPTGSMKDTLLVGDFLLVNKFVYGVRTPDQVPFINAKIPWGPFRLPEFKQPQNGDVVVFKYPEDPSLDYIKRCIAIAGQTIEVVSEDVFIDGKPEGKKVDLGDRYDSSETESRNIKYTKITTPFGKTYRIRHYVEKYAPFERYGPVKVPQTGMTVPINAKTPKHYLTAIANYEHNENAEIRGEKLFVQGREIKEYTFKQDYYFMMGDNRDNSADSRSWGFLPAENVVGEALVIYFSWDTDSRAHFLNLLDKVRWQRVSNLIR